MCIRDRIQGVLYGVTFIQGGRSVRLGVLASVGNFLVFFSGDIIQRLKTGRRRMEHRANQAAAREAESASRHRCRICGKTELTHPQLDFRYCSKCAGDECYCSEHLANHEHTVTKG